MAGPLQGSALLLLRLCYVTTILTCQCPRALVYQFIYALDIDRNPPYSTFTQGKQGTISKNFMSICCKHQNERLTSTCLFKCTLTLMPSLISCTSKGALIHQWSVTNAPCEEGRGSTQLCFFRQVSSECILSPHL